jgi:hypothetical protein
MQVQSFNSLLHSVKGGDLAAASRLQRLLRPVVARAVRQAIQNDDHTSPLGQRVQGMLAQGQPNAADRPGAAEQIAQAICGQTVAQLRSSARRTPAALETVCG